MVVKNLNKTFRVLLMKNTQQRTVVTNSFGVHGFKIYYFEFLFNQKDNDTTQL